jgi:hypothetical protein
MAFPEKAGRCQVGSSWFLSVILFALAESPLSPPFHRLCAAQFLQHDQRRVAFGLSTKDKEGIVAKVAEYRTISAV